MINAAVRRLQRKRATAQNVYISTFCFDREQGYDDEQLLNTCDASNNALSKVPALVKDAWEVITSMSTAIETLEFQDACDLIPLLETRSAALDAYVTRIEEQVAVYGCSSALKPSKIPEVYALTLSHYLASVALCLLVVLVKLINPKKAKPKLN
jgi:hypothetical protein